LLPEVIDDCQYIFLKPSHYATFWDKVKYFLF